MSRSRTTGPAQAVQPNGSGEPGPFRLNASLAPSYRGDTDRMISDVRDWLADGWRVVLVTEGHGPAQRLAEMLRGEDIGARLQDLDEPPEAGVSLRDHGACLGNGFLWPAARLALLTESDLAGHVGRAAEHQGHAADAEPAARRRRPAAAARPVTTWCTSSTASAGTWR